MIDPEAIKLLQVPLQTMVLAYQSAFPGGGLASGRRSIDRQATADATDVVRSRAFIANTYMPSPVRDAMIKVCDDNPKADAATLAPEFAAVLGTFTDEELSHFSLHLSGYAADLTPPDEATRVACCAWARQWVADYIATGGGNPNRCRVLTLESGEVVIHCQLVPATIPSPS